MFEFLYRRDPEAADIAFRHLASLAAHAWRSVLAQAILKHADLDLHYHEWQQDGRERCAVDVTVLLAGQTMFFRLDGDDAEAIQALLHRKFQTGRGTHRVAHCPHSPAQPCPEGVRE